MSNIVDTLLHQNDVIHEYERLVEHLTLTLVTGEKHLCLPIDETYCPGADVLCKKLEDWRKERAEKKTSIVPVFHTTQS